MKKYLVIFSQTFSFASFYRFQIFLSVVQGFITPILMLVAISFTRPLSSQTASSLIPYYLVIGLIFPFVHSAIDEEMDELSATGEINNFLTKPIGLYRWLLLKNLSEKVSTLAYFSPILLLVFIFVPQHGFWPLAIISMFISVLLSFLVYFNLSYLTGLLCFWIDEFWAIHNVKYVTIQLLGGFIVPLAFFPDWFSSLVRHTPFFYLGSWNTQVAQSGLKIFDLASVVVWVVITRLLIRIMEEKAISKYSFTGS